MINFNRNQPAEFPKVASEGISSHLFAPCNGTNEKALGLPLACPMGAPKPVVMSGSLEGALKLSLKLNGVLYTCQVMPKQKEINMAPLVQTELKWNYTLLSYPQPLSCGDSKSRLAIKNAGDFHRLQN